MLGSFLAWLFTGLAIHVLVLYYAAMISSQRLAEDKEVGALELILSSPVTERQISRGLWMAFLRRMLFPALVAVLAHGLVLWQGMVLCTLDPPGPIPKNTTTAWTIFRAILLDEPIAGRSLEWGFVFMVRMALLLVPMLVLVWFTLGWVARWLGLRMKHPGFAPMVSLALVFVPPILLFSLVCYIIEETKLNRMPQRQLLPLMLGLAIGIGLVHCLLLCTWAARRLRNDFRDTVIGRFHASPRRWLPNGRTVMHFMLRTAAFAGVLTVLGAAFYGCQNYRSRHAWSAFQAELKQRGLSLDLAPLLPAPVPDADNFASARAFQDILSVKSKTARRLLDSLQSDNQTYPAAGQAKNTTVWTEQSYAPLGKFGRWMSAEAMPDENTENAVAAPVLLKLLQPDDDIWRAISAAALRPSFQVTTNRSAQAVLQSPGDIMERLHLVFTIRASARLQTGLVIGAGDDLLTSLRLAQLARQSPDSYSTTREQFMLMRSFQPLWEGLAGHQWNKPQLDAIQAELDRFNLLVDHTNAVHRLVLANIEIWKAIPNSSAAQISVPSGNGGFRVNSDWEAQPRAWWYYNCIQLYRLGENMIAQMDVPGERVWLNMSWNELYDLPLDHESQQFFWQYQWNGITPAAVTFAQTSLNQARIACALERFRLTNGAYPQKLDELVPIWLKRIPNDVLRGLPITYEPVENNSYRLRAFGPNFVNDRTNSVSDDWLWAYPTNAPAAVQSP